MAIQVTQITGDTVELVFNPSEDDLHIGENLALTGRQDDRRLIIQVIELQSLFQASVWFSRDRRQRTNLLSVPSTPGNRHGRSSQPRKSPPVPENHALHLAVAKIRKLADPAWHPWDGWLPTGAVMVSRITDHEILRRCIPAPHNPLWLGKTLAGEPFHIEAASLGTVNLIVGAAGSGT